MKKREGNTSMEKVDVLIPTYRPGEQLKKLLESLMKQTVMPDNIRIINTDESLWREAFSTEEFLERFDRVKLSHIKPGEFDHGATRHSGIEQSQAEFVLCMTQDAIPADEYVIERLLAPFEDRTVAVSYARQLPAPDASAIEVFTRQYNYPDTDQIKGKEDISTLGIKTFFCSNVCAMYRRSTYEELGGFIRHTIFNEDMIFAAHAVRADYRIAYVAGAKVIHSHNYTGMQQFRRNFDLGVSQADHPEIFEEVPSESTGIRMVCHTAGYLLCMGKPWLLFKLIWLSGCKYMGYRMGKRYQKLSKRKLARYTMNPAYWTDAVPDERRDENAQG